MTKEKQIRAFFKRIESTQYVVQRNWKNLPYDYDKEDGDIDLFCRTEEKEFIQEAIKEFPDLRIDVRCPLDDYYPDMIGHMLLGDRIKKDCFYIPNPEARFLALYYHSRVHKQDHPYREELDKLFLEIHPPIKCRDEGVGYFV